MRESASGTAIPRYPVRCDILRPSQQAGSRQIGGSACGYQAIFVPSTALASPGYDGQPAVYLYIAALEVNVLNCRQVRVWFASRPDGKGDNAGDQDPRRHQRAEAEWGIARVSALPRRPRSRAYPRRSNEGRSRSSILTWSITLARLRMRETWGCWSARRSPRRGACRRGVT